MEWSKAKNILIVLLLLVDTFLLGIYIFRAEEENSGHENIRTEICTVLKKQGIEISKNMIPLDSMEFNPATVDVREMKREEIGKLLGNITETTSEDYTTFSGENGTFMYNKDSFSLVYESGKPIYGAESAKKLSEEIASALSVRTNSEAFRYGKSDGGYTVKIPQIISGIELFDCSIEIKISESGSVIAHGSYLCDGEITTYSDKVSTVSAVMLSFADAVKEKGISGINVSDVRVGYMAKASDSKRVSLAPAIGIETDSGLFLVDMQTERVYVE